MGLVAAMWVRQSEEVLYERIKQEVDQITKIGKIT